MLAKHYPPQPQISSEAIVQVEGIIQEARAHPERFQE
jgi:hypothetical protein